MGYALFANRKLYLHNMEFMLQQKLDNIMRAEQRMLEFSANITDGKVTIEEMASDPSNYYNYMTFLGGSDAFKDMEDADGGYGTTVSEIGNMAYETDQSEAYLAAVASLLDTSVGEIYAQQECKKVEAEQHRLEMEKNKIETQLTAVQKEIESVEDAEGKAIEQATPKYSGVSR